MKALLDTHVLLWWLGKSPLLTKAQQRVLHAASATNPVFVSDISLWEIATLVDLKRVRLSLPLREWLERAVAGPVVQRVGISPAVAAEVGQLPATFHRDPADRIIVATAKVIGASLLTSDGPIIKSEIVPTVC